MFNIQKKKLETYGLMAGGAYLLWLIFDPKRAAGATTGFVGNILSGATGQVIEGGTALGNTIYDGLNYDWRSHPDEAVWETPYWKLKKDQYRAFYGPKPRVVNFHAGQLDVPTEAKLSCSMVLYMSAPNVAGTLKPRPGAGQYSLHYNGGPAGSLIGDPRALYSLDHLMRISNLVRLDHMGIQPGGVSNPTPGGKGDFGHQSGCGIDITNAQQTNALIEAAKVARMPICWISRTKVAGKGWPIFLLADRIKVGPIGYSPINHNSHEHLILPRPNWASNHWNKG